MVPMGVLICFEANSHIFIPFNIRYFMLIVHSDLLEVLAKLCFLIKIK